MMLLRLRSDRETPSVWNVSKRSACSNRRRLGAIREMADVDGTGETDKSIGFLSLSESESP